jgi:hypothetical protein
MKQLLRRLRPVGARSAGEKPLGCITNAASQIGKPRWERLAGRPRAPAQTGGTRFGKSYPGPDFTSHLKTGYFCHPERQRRV